MSIVRPLVLLAVLMLAGRGYYDARAALAPIGVSRVYAMLTSKGASCEGGGQPSAIRSVKTVDAAAGSLL